MRARNERGQFEQTVGYIRNDLEHMSVKHLQMAYRRMRDNEIRRLERLETAGVANYGALDPTLGTFDSSRMGKARPTPATMAKRPNGAKEMAQEILDMQSFLYFSGSKPSELKKFKKRGNKK